MSNIAFLLEWAQMLDLDFGLIRQNISAYGPFSSQAFIIWSPESTSKRIYVSESESCKRLHPNQYAHDCSYSH